LAGPFLLGISAGSGLMVIMAIVLGIYLAYIPILAWIGALLTVILVAVISNSSSGISIQKLILSGVAISSLFGAIQSVLLLRSDDSRIQTALQWLIGSLNSIEWSLLVICGSMIIAGLIGTLFCLKSLDILNLDDSMAKNMGLNISTKRLTIALIATCLSASAVSISGLIGFVGLVAPHSARIILSTNVPSKVVPASAILGAIFLLISDTISRSFANELPVGAITSLFGSPLFIILLMRLNSQKQITSQ
jgi:iron complex transport system permease protein